MRVAIADSSYPEAEALLKDYFPGIELKDDNPDLRFVRVNSYDDAMKVIRFLRAVAPKYLQEFVEDSEDYEGNDKK